MIIRDFRPEDDEAIVELWRVCGLLHPLNDPHDDIALCQRSGHGALLVGEDAGSLIATCMVGHDGHRGWIYYLAVRPDHRGSSWGRQMVEAAEHWLTERGRPKVQLMIRESNAEVREFYRRVGYQIEPRIIMSRRLDGKTAVLVTAEQADLIETTVTYLQMKAQPEGPATPAPPGIAALLRADRPSLDFYRYLYDAIGRDWLWLDRKRMNDEELGAIIGDERDEIYVLYVDGVPAGYAELDRRSPPDIELAYFGLIPDFIGRGVGRFLLDSAIRQAWSYAPSRLWVHTCTLDHPNALPLYQKAGFQVYKRETGFMDPNI